MFGLEHFGFVGLDKRAQLTVCIKGSPEANPGILGPVWAL